MQLTMKDLQTDCLPSPCLITFCKRKFKENNEEGKVGKLQNNQKFQISMIYIEVTRELLQIIPAQLLPQGSDPSQFGGKLFQLDLRAKRAEAAQ